MVHKIFKYFIGCKDNKEIRPLSIFFPEMSFIYKRYSDKTKCMYFMIKDEKTNDKHLTIWEKITNIIKKINSELTYNKEYLRAEKNSTQRKAFNVFIYRFISANCLIQFIEKMENIILKNV